jgi:hypothetical protein
MQRKMFFSTAIFFLLALVLLLVALARAAEVTLAWDPNGVNPDGYRLYKRLAGEPYDFSKPLDAGKNTVSVITGLMPGKTYYFIVRSWLGASESGDSNEVSYTVPEETCVTFLTGTGDPVGKLVPGTYLLDGYGLIAEVYPPPEDNDLPPYSVNSSRTIYHRQGCRYYNPSAGIQTPEECPTCRACKICGKEE